MSRVLCVDDSRHIRTMVQGILPESYEFFAAANGEEALEFMNTMDFDVVLLDLVMPVMDGFETLRRLQKRKNVPPILLFTSTVDQSKLKEARALGIADFILKPCDLEFLKEKLIFVATNHDVEIGEGMGEFDGQFLPEDDGGGSTDEDMSLDVLDFDERPPPPRRVAPPLVVSHSGNEGSDVLGDAYGFFVIQQVSHPTRIFELSSETVRMGRGNACELVLGNESVSRTHCVLKRSGRDIVLTDLDSSNGTIVNGYDIQETILAHDDQIRVGRYFLTFKTYNYEVMSEIEKYDGLATHQERPKKNDDATQMMAPACVDAFMDQISLENDMILMSMDYAEESYPVPREKFELGSQAMPCPDFEGGTGVFIEWKDGAHWLTRRRLGSSDVFVNGESVRKIQLSPGDVIEIGEVGFAYQYCDSEE